MNKLDLIIALKNKTKLAKPEAEAVVNLFFNEMSSALAKGDRVEIRGLCSFFILCQKIQGIHREESENWRTEGG